MPSRHDALILLAVYGLGVVLTDGVFLNLKTLFVTNGSTGLAVSSSKSGTYFMRVRAKNACGVSSASKEVRVVFP